MKNQRDEEEEGDRISQLPQRLLHEILCYLSQKEAVQTCVLSKSWRHFGPTRPKIEFREKWFSGENKKEAFLSFVKTSLQRYEDQKLSIEDFLLEISEVDSEWTHLLEKWVPVVMLNMGVKTFNLSILPKSSTAPYFDLPSEVFRAQNLYLERCKLSQINCIPNYVVFKHLQTLGLRRVHIEDETFEKIMSCCPSIEDVSLVYCAGLETIYLTDKLKRFEFKKYDFYNCEADLKTCDIKIDDFQTIESINISWGCPPLWFQQHCHNNFMHLKVLCLEKMYISTESFSTFSSHNFPCLEDLTIDSCYGFEEIKLSSCSIERLTFSDLEKTINMVSIHAPNILYFKYGYCYDFPSSFSFTTASGRRGWKSDLCLGDGCLTDSSCFFRLNEVLRALSQSEISLDISMSQFFDHDIEGGSFERVAVEHLVIVGDVCYKIPRSFLTLLFRVCRPRYIKPLGFCAIGVEIHVELPWLLYKFLLQMRKGRDSQRADLEEFDMDLREDNEECLFRLKWRDSS